jgi:hypothetical protein
MERHFLVRCQIPLCRFSGQEMGFVSTEGLYNIPQLRAAPSVAAKTYYHKVLENTSSDCLDRQSRILVYGPSALRIQVA